MTDEYGSQPPSDIQAEQSVLGGMLLSMKVIPDVVDRMSAEDFYRPNHATVFRTIVDVWMRGDEVDAVTVAAELDKQGLLRQVGGAPYLHTLISTVPTAANAGHYANIVVSKAKLRKMGELGVRLRQLAADDLDQGDVEAVLAQGEKWFRELHKSDERAIGFDDLVENFRESLTSDSVPSIPTPWDALNDRLIGGLQRGRLYTVGARPGVGKSVALLNMAAFAAHWDYKTAVFSLEMSAGEVTTRLIAQGARVNQTRLIKKQIDLEMSDRIERYAKENEGVALQVIDRETITVEQIIAHCRAAGPFDVIVVDYLQLIEPSDRRAVREQQVAHLSRSLKIAARELNAAVIVAAQLNRGPLKDGKPRAPVVSDLRESGAVEQDSDCVLLLHQDEDEPGYVTMIVGKNRQGKTGDMLLKFEGQYARISE
ncbi:replicative DNA helicase [Mycobacteroides abscessus]|uniref:replicative DNA helicase n=1 Tax=Mycobacteroides abscessus TaxID=36809 RepID=UPI00092A0B64|nr:DnaB-like helicase C-terminal domain-containing protein [Mycobacteroides abscessus]SIM48444.1 replicative DNA helicase [Mycobacteroides abscessus subsp. abscessus]SLC89457.1 replicative DNA helicase [Mycobacteroides abscessus subsp. abscessus]